MPPEPSTVTIDGQSFNLDPPDVADATYLRFLRDEHLRPFPVQTPATLRQSAPSDLLAELAELSNHLETLLHEHKRLNSPRAFTRDLEAALIDVQARQRAYRARVAQRVQGAV